MKEFKLTAVVFAVLKNASDELLLVKNAHFDGKNRWTLPGGKVEPGETLAEALRREVYEETSYDISVSQVAYIHEAFFPDHASHVRATIFQAEIENNASLKSSESCFQAQNDPSILCLSWVPLNKIDQYFQNPEILRPLMQWLKNKTSCRYYYSKEMKW